MSQYARVTITLPPEDLEAADRLAAELDRSRSWIIAEAVRRFVVANGEGAVVALDPSRRIQLARDADLPLDERLRLTEAPALEPAPAAPIRTFSSYDDFAAWRRAERDAEG